VASRSAARRGVSPPWRRDRVPDETIENERAARTLDLRTPGLPGISSDRPEVMRIESLRNTGVQVALVSAVLFGAITPLAKLLLGDISPWMLAGLIYLGSGLGSPAALPASGLRRANDGRWPAP